SSTPSATRPGAARALAATASSRRPTPPARSSTRPPMRSTTACRVRRAPLALRLALTIVVGLAARPLPTSAEAPVAAAGAAAAPPTLAALLEGFRTMPGFEARFEEEKTLALLAAPLKSRGRLYFAPPATLLRRVEAPDPHDILIREQV